MATPEQLAAAAQQVFDRFATGSIPYETLLTNMIRMRQMADQDQGAAPFTAAELRTIADKISVLYHTWATAAQTAMTEPEGQTIEERIAARAQSIATVRSIVMHEVITLYHYDGTEMREATYRLFDTPDAIDTRPRHPVQARLHGLILEESEEHGGPILVDEKGTIWSIDNALAMGKVTIIG